MLSSPEISIAGASIVDTSGGRVDTPQWAGVSPVLNVVAALRRASDRLAPRSMRASRPITDRGSDRRLFDRFNSVDDRARDLGFGLTLHSDEANGVGNRQKIVLTQSPELGFECLEPIQVYPW